METPETAPIMEQASTQVPWRRAETALSTNSRILASLLSELPVSMLLWIAAVGGGIPLISTLQRGLQANEIQSVAGILNGTTNFILTQMEEKGQSFQDALADAQALGFAEADPTNDVKGFDVAYKISILASLAFGRFVRGLGNGRLGGRGGLR